MTPGAGRGAVGALLGIAFFFAVYGASIVDPARIDWLLHGDPAQHYFGFAFFRNSPWTWPLGAVPDLGAPLGTSLVYTDAIPLLALAFKLFSPWLPVDFQYLGGWMLLCYALHGAFAERVLMRLGVKGVARIAAVALLLTSPALALRAYGHESLMAHWLLLASFDAALANRPRAQGPILVTGALVHPYWVVMLAPFVALAWWRDRVGWKHCAGWIAFLAFAMAAAGYFIARPGQLAAEGYGFYSANLLTFFDPMDWQAFLRHYGRAAEGGAQWSRLLPALGQATAGQYEGFAYLGAGVLLLAALASALSVTSGARRGSAARSFALLALPALGLFAYALSTRIGIGPWLVTDPELSPRLLAALGVFRSSGRFVWPLALLISIWACWRVASGVPPRQAVVLLFAGLILQGYDQSAKWVEFHRRFAPGGLGALPELSAQGWSATAGRRHLVVLAAPGDRGWIAPALHAARHRMTINTALLSRPDEDAARRAIDAAAAEILAGTPRADTAYWVRDPALLARLPDGIDARARRLALGDGTMVVSR